MTTTNLSDSDISARLAEHISRLSQMTASVQDTASTYVLNHLEPRLRQGLVRIAVIGTTGAGKSTTINALTECLVLPENPSTSSPIPVWIGYHDAKPSVEIYRSDNGSVIREVHSVPDFQRKYCYHMQDIIDKDRTRYNTVEFGAVSLRSPIVQGNVTLIDTLGIAATTVDSRKTIRVLEEGVDAVIFVTNKSQLTLSERRFLRSYVLGCASRAEPDAQTVSTSQPILPENLLFVHNCFYGVPNQTAFAEGIRSFYRDCSLELTEEQIDAFATRNVFFIQAQNARLGRLGVYPYVDRAPEGCSGEERDAAKGLEMEEQELLDEADRELLVKQSGITELAEGIRQLSRRLGYGENAVSVKRIRELVEVVDGVIQSADTRIASKNITITQLNNQKERFQQIKLDDDADQKTLSDSMDALSKEYVASFAHLLEDVVRDLTTDCAGQALRMPMPLSFRNAYREYLRMDRSGKEKYLEDLLPQVVKQIYEYCITETLKALDERRTDDYATPFAVMEKVKDFMQMQEVVFQGRIDSLKNANAQELGMFFPQPLVVRNLFDKLGQDLQEKVKQIIADACTTGGKAFEQSMGKYIKGCSLNFLQSFAGLVFQDHAAKKLWSNITKSLFKPLAEAIVCGIPAHAEKTIYTQTTDAFRNTRDEICRSHIQLFVSLEITMAQLEAQLNNAVASANQTQADMQTLKQTCEDIRKDILAMQYQLQNI